jgi:Trypsin-like peptidase domain
MLPTRNKIVYKDDDDGRWVTRQSLRGQPYRVWEWPVPRINDGILECVVYIYPDVPTAQNGEAAGGTGFLVGTVVSEQFKKSLIFVVTNRHVIDKGGRVVRINTADGKLDTKEIEDNQWLRHPSGDDIAIAALPASGNYRANFLPFDLAIKEEEITSQNVGPGDDVFIVGRFVNHDGKQQNRPSVRFGAIAQMPGEAIKFPDGSEQDSFLVEARSISGFSGSPVFLSRSGGAMYRVRLLGIDHCHLSSSEPIKSKITGESVSDHWYVKNNTGMMGVVPAWRLSEMFAMPEVQKLIACEKSRLEKEYRDAPGEQD